MKIAVFTECSSEYGRRLVDGVAAYAGSSRDLRLTWINPGRDIPPETFDGCAGIIARVATDAIARRLGRTGLPVVDVFCQNAYPGFIGINSDHEKIGRLAAEHFLSKRHVHFAFAGFKGVSFSRKRRRAFSAALAEHGFTPSVRENELARDQRAFFNTDACPITDVAGLTAWLADLPRPTAVFAANDLLALNVLQLAREAGLDVPGDLAVLGVDDDRLLCAFTETPLSSIDPNAFGIGFAAARMLTAAIRTPPSKTPRPVHHVSPKGIVERQSTACHAIKPDWLAQALGRIDASLDQPLSTADLVRMTGRSHVTITNAFRTKFGTSPLRYITEMKMRAARRMLGDGKLLAKEVAARTGYQSLSRFSIVYKSYWGHPPTKENSALTSPAINAAGTLPKNSLRLETT